MSSSFLPFPQRNYKLQRLSQHAPIWTQAIICGTYRYKKLISAMKKSFYVITNSSKCGTNVRLWNLCGVGQCFLSVLLYAALFPAFFPGLTASLKLYSGSRVYRVCRGPVVGSFVLHSALVTEPMILLGWQFRKFSLLIVVSLGTWMLCFSGSFPICPFLGHGLFLFWVSGTDLDQGCLTMALCKKLDCK